MTTPSNPPDKQDKTADPKRGRYVSYDIRGIQQYIFAIPKLKYIVGGSSMIDQFDRETAESLASPHSATFIYAGGGRGMYYIEKEVPDDQVKNKTKDLIQAIKAVIHKLGLDVRIGQSGDINSTEATDLYTCPPTSLEGEPCAVSGLFPVGKDQKNKRGIHHLILDRREAAQKDRLGNNLLDKIRPQFDWLYGETVQFLSNVTPDPISEDANEIKQDQLLAEQGQSCLGSRNRWTVIVMDGNDLGNQHRKATDHFKDDADARQKWQTAMSQAIDKTTRGAVAAALKTMLEKWKEDCDKAKTSIHAKDDAKTIVLPVRPLIVGGDDVILLCHAQYAMKLVQDICEAFNRISKQYKDCWLGTGGEMTISAGVVFCNTHYPLASAIEYAESLLSQAKKHGREANLQKQGIPIPACIDWESLTDGLIDTPSSRRQRELIFQDGDLNIVLNDGSKGNPTIQLTQRPYTMESFTKLQETKKELTEKLKIPVSILHEFLDGLRQGFYDRSMFLIRHRKNHYKLCDALLWKEEEFQQLLAGKLSKDTWWTLEADKKDPNKKTVSTHFIDAFLLLQEDHRMDNPTTDSKKENA